MNALCLLLIVLEFTIQKEFYLYSTSYSHLMFFVCEKRESGEKST